jgi:hypothetical protein
MKTSEGNFSVWKSVTKEEFEAFIKAYPKPLKYDVTGICEPPLASYNDFSDGKVWPESMVAKISLEEASYMGKPNEYLIKIEEAKSD